MNKRLALLLAGVMTFSCFTIIHADTMDYAYNDTTYIDTPHIRTTDSSTTTTDGSTTTTDDALKCGITEKVITTEKGTIEILDDGTIITTGDTTYNPKTGNFDVPNPYWTNYEPIYIGGWLQEIYGNIGGNGIRYGKGATINKNYSFVYNDEVYTIDKGDIYTRWYMKDDDVNNMNIMPLMSFMEMDNKWFFFEMSTVLSHRYVEDEPINEIVATNKATVQLAEDIEIKNEAQTFSRGVITEQNKILPDGSLLIVTEGKASYITDFGIIPKNTIINYPDGSVELISERMSIVGENINVKIQNFSGNNNNIVFENYVINKTDAENPPVTPSPSPEPSPTPTPTEPIDNDNDDSSDKENVVVKPQSLDKTKRYQYSVEDNLTIRNGNEVIKLKKGDKIILPNGTESVLTELPKGTKLINSGKTIILNGGYSLSRRVSFKVIEERDAIELFIEMFLVFFNKLK